MINFKNKDIVPMKLKVKDKPFNDPEFLFEPKYDGVRALIYVSKNEITIINRNGRVLNDRFPELLKIKNNIKNECIFDGEVVLMEGGKPSFRKLQERALLKDKERIIFMKSNFPVTFICFDILYENKDLTRFPLIKRKEILNKYEDSDFFVKTMYVINDGVKLFKSARSLGLEGIVAKNINSFYKFGVRSEDWVKIKNWQDDEFFIGGFYDNPVDSMLTIVVGKYVQNKLFYSAKTRVTKKSQEYKIIKKMGKVRNSPFEDFQEKKFTYIKPKLKCTVEYVELTSNNHLRQPVYKGLRLD